MNKLLVVIMVIAVLAAVCGEQVALAQDRGGGGSSRGGRGTSEARQAASRVVAVADENTNSIAVSAPEDIMPIIEELIAQIDGVGEDNTEIRVFPLRYADAQEMADIIMGVFEESRYSRQRFGGQRQSQRQIEESMVVAVGDVRTNSVIVTAVSETMRLVEQMISALDADPAKDRKVFVYQLDNANGENVQEILQNMFEGQTGRRSTTTRSSSTRSTAMQRAPSSQSGRSSGFGGSSSGSQTRR